MPGWVSALLRLALLTWPRAQRVRDGDALATAVADGWLRQGRGFGRLPWLALEVWDIAAAGLRLRVDRWALVTEAVSSGLRQDLHRAIRRMARTPGFTVLVVGGCSLGIGATAALLGVARHALTVPEFMDDARIVFVWRTLGEEEGRYRIAGPDAASIADRVREVDGVAFVSTPLDAGVEPAPGAGVTHVRLSRVSPHTFELLGVRPALGPPAVEATLTEGTAVLSHGAWDRIFARDSAVIGRMIRVNEVPTTVVAVLGADFDIPFPADVGMRGTVDVWTPLAGPLTAFRRTDGRQLDQDSDNTGAVLARLREEASLDDARSRLALLATELRAEVEGYDQAEVGFSIRQAAADATEERRPLVFALLLAAGCLVVVTCLNTSTLLLARAGRRAPEHAVMMFLGAGRARVARMALIEVTALIGVGALTAMPAAALITRWAPPLISSVPTSDVAPDQAVLCAVALLCLLVTAAAALRPILRLTPEGAGLAGGGSRIVSARARTTPLVGQVAVSVVLLTMSGALTAEAARIYAWDPGFEHRGALTFAASARVPGDHGSPAERARIMRSIHDGLLALPGVEAVGMTAHLPLSGTRWTQPYALPGEPFETRPARRADFVAVSSGYLAALGAPLLAGRAFTEEEDLVERERVVVVDARLAARLAPDGAAVGRRIRIPLDGAVVEAEVVGVVGSIRGEHPQREGREAVYVPYRQEASRDVRFVVRTSASPEDLTEVIRGVVLGVDPSIPIHDLRTLSSYVEERAGPVRTSSALVGAFALFVLLSVAVGIYGVLAFDVSRRTREIGLRFAVGASRTQVAGTVCLRALGVVALGTALGAGTSLWVAPFLPGIGTTGLGARLAIAIPTVLAVVTVAGSIVPVWRATALDPREALRAD